MDTTPRLALNPNWEFTTVHLPSDDPAWVKYAGGKARTLLSINRYSWTNADLFWLLHNAPDGMTNEVDICKYFDRQLTALEVTERITS